MKKKQREITDNEACVSMCKSGGMKQPEVGPESQPGG